jgi:ABC-type antimicrobial peptide transport system permease subunit
MALVPIAYSVRSLFVRRSSTVLTICAVGATIAVLAGMLSLGEGFATMFQARGRTDLAVFLRKGATSEGESGITREQCEILTKEVPEVERNAEGRPLASAEMFLAMLLPRYDGGKTNVAMRGVEPMTFDIHGDDVQILPGGRRFAPGSDELIVGSALVDRIADCKIGDVLRINTVPFRIVGAFTGKGGYVSEIWGDLDRLSEALQRPVRSRVIAKVAPGANLAAVQQRYESDLRVQPKVETERDYLASQTSDLSWTFLVCGIFLAVIMGVGALFTGINSMLSTIGARIHEIGVLKALGYRPYAILLAFLFEAVVIGVLGGLVGCALVLPLQGLQFGTMNQTFSEVVFGFRTTPLVMLQSIVFAGLLGLVGGMFPALRAARMRPTQALRRG